LRRLGTYFHPLGAEAGARIKAALARVAGSQTLVATTIEVNGRRLDFLAAGSRVLSASFDDLCRQPLGAADYLALAERFQALALTGIPRLAAEQRNEAQRLAMLIDILYDHGVKLICSADGPPDALYPHGTGAFEFKRAVSRLNEMQTDGYLQRPHRP
jgi:cell division protein ZapE